MIARVNWGRKKPRSARLPAFDELVLPGILHAEDMGDSWCIIIGDGDVRLHVTASRRDGKSRVTVIEESGVRR